MKPPARSRREPQRFDRTSVPDGQQLCRWPRTDQMKLLGALRTLGKTARVTGGLDYGYLRKCVRSRSASEMLGQIVSVVEALKAKAITSASISLKTQSWRQKRDRKPIEAWMDLASAVTGAQDQALSLAFSQMLMVSSTEPRSLANSEPPLSFRPPIHRERCPPPPRTPLAAPSKLSGVGPSAVAPPILIIKAPPPSTGPEQQLLHTPPTQLQTSSSEPGTPRRRPTVATTSPQSAGDPVTQATLQHPATSQAAEAPPPSSSSSQSTEMDPTSSETIANGHSPSSSSSAPIPNCTPPSFSQPDPTPPSSSSTPTTVLHSGVGRLKAGPRGKNVVNFEKIYQFLSVLNKEDECSLTAMESAVVLDLLMSLPEELPLLDCNKLHHHFLQVHCCLSGPVGSEMAAKIFKGLKPEQQQSGKQAAASHRSHPEGPVTGPDAQQNGTGPEPNGDVDRGHTDCMNREGKPADGSTERLCPPLNPFMVPLDLLTRRSPKP